jgi:hypothetical protein
MAQVHVAEFAALVALVLDPVALAGILEHPLLPIGVRHLPGVGFDDRPQLGGAGEQRAVGVERGDPRLDVDARRDAAGRGKVDAHGRKSPNCSGPSLSRTG